MKDATTPTPADAAPAATYLCFECGWTGDKPIGQAPSLACPRCHHFGVEVTAVPAARPTLRRIVVLPMSEVAAVDYDVPYAIVSIRDPGDRPPIRKRWGLRGVLPLEFHDFDPVPDVTVPDSFRAKAMQAHHAEALAAFVRGLDEDVEVLVVHCFAGVSRSISAAMAIADHLNLGRGSIEWLRAHCLDSHHLSPPNQHVYRLTREALRLVATQAAEMEGRGRGGAEPEDDNPTTGYPPGFNPYEEYTMTEDEAALMRRILDPDDPTGKPGTGIVPRVLKEIDIAAQPAPAEVETRLADGPSLHSVIMNLPLRPPPYSESPARAYKLGHRDARHAAAEAALEFDERLRVALAGVELVKAGVAEVAAERDRARAEADRLWAAMSMVRAHTGRMPYASRELLDGLLSSVERIADAALAAPAEPAGTEGTP
jgi:predicted protein tyrosine phosphatase